MRLAKSKIDVEGEKGKQSKSSNFIDQSFMGETISPFINSARISILYLAKEMMKHPTFKLNLVLGDGELWQLNFVFLATFAGQWVLGSSFSDPQFPKLAGSRVEECAHGCLRGLCWQSSPRLRREPCCWTGHWRHGQFLVKLSSTCQVRVHTLCFLIMLLVPEPCVTIVAVSQHDLVLLRVA